MQKRLVLCLDGTWNSGFEERKRRDGHDVLKPTNPLKLCRAVCPTDPKSGMPQITYYDLGVGALAEYPGTANKTLQFVDRFLGGAWGAGFEGNVEDALNFLVHNFETGDEVFVFGFSRGAAQARAVTMFLDWNGGLPEKEDAYYLPRLFRHYVRTQGRAGECAGEVQRINVERSMETRAGKPRPLPPIKPFRPLVVKFLGVWDTVMALGSRLDSVEGPTSVHGRTFYAGDAPADCVQFARQALAIDEQRYDFRPEIWTKSGIGQMEQRWFAGVHSNVGGSYGNDGLANIAFRWILEGAVQRGLMIDRKFVAFYRRWLRDTLGDSYSSAYRFLDRVRHRAGEGVRSLVAVPQSANATLEPRVIRRMQTHPSRLAPNEDGTPATAYRPRNVIEFLAAQPDLDAYLKRLRILAPLPDDVLEQIRRLKR